LTLIESVLCCVPGRIFKKRVIINFGDPQNEFGTKSGPQNEFCTPSGRKMNLERKVGRKMNFALQAAAK